MADPRTELADIVVPLAPVSTPAAAGVSPGWMIAAAIAVMTLALLAGWWHRRRFARSLQGICDAVARRQGRPDTLARLLDIWARDRFDLIRLDARQCPKAVAAGEWAEWVEALSTARFAPRSSEAWEGLARLCESARRWKHG